jgi:hypothetical protein
MRINQHSFRGLTAEIAQELGCGSVEFDYAAIDHSAPSSPEDHTATMCDPKALEGFRAALSILVDLIIPPGGAMPAPQTMGIRLIALLQLVRPEALDGKSMNEIAKETGVTRAALSKMLVAYSDTLAFWARHQRSHKARLTYSDVQRGRRIRNRLLRSAARGAESEPRAAA